MSQTATKKSNKKAEDFIMPFGKYKGDTLDDIRGEDPKYLDYLRGLEIVHKPLRDAVEEMNNKYASEIEEAIGD